ncbi:DNA-binding NarL/FixJ family response regulator [Arthrobacter stackebrandtii]|uniref:DNA-binding NarL/FixJ family response regulator n=1 Tax=Arthrobacter stackebrandtii TaxID=272161 RepID=A0ABS4Z066_9MICC|nr:response regulator transcription factor [Arthrobacter stackebrandtii]MBP2414110.1 DNA-binding NarL/FixJ family response regulator [Arthrobacter stackebrandtii]
MNAGIAEKTGNLRMAVVGSDYITGLGLTQLLDQAPFITNVGSVATAGQVLAMADEWPVDLVLVDAAIQGQDLAAACRSLIESENPPTVVVMGEVPFNVAESLVLCGVTAFLNPGLVAEDLPVALRLIQRGGAILLSDAAREALVARGRSFDTAHRSRYETLNAREKVVAEGVAEGKTNLELAADMHVSEATVKLLVSNVMNKLGVCNRVQVAVIATKARII